MKSKETNLSHIFLPAKSHSLRAWNHLSSKHLGTVVHLRLCCHRFHLDCSLLQHCLKHFAKQLRCCGGCARDYCNFYRIVVTLLRSAYLDRCILVFDVICHFRLNLIPRFLSLFHATKVTLVFCTLRSTKHFPPYYRSLLNITFHGL